MFETGASGVAAFALPSSSAPTRSGMGWRGGQAAGCRQGVGIPARASRWDCRFPVALLRLLFRRHGRGKAVEATRALVTTRRDETRLVAVESSCAPLRSEDDRGQGALSLRG